MASKLKLQPKPTFTSKVPVPVPGAEPDDVTFTFKHRKKDEVDEFIKNSAKATDDFQVVMSMVVGWDLEDEFNEENVRSLLSNYIAAPEVIFEVYLRELAGNRRKN